MVWWAWQVPAPLWPGTGWAVVEKGWGQSWSPSEALFLTALITGSKGTFLQALGITY